MVASAAPQPPASTHPELPRTFRREVTPHVFGAIRASESVSLVGLPGSGKSNLIHFICHPAVACHSIGGARDWLLACVDHGLMRDETEGSFCRAVLEALAQAGRENAWPESDQSPLSEALRYYSDYERELTGLGVLARVLDILCREKRRRVVLAFDGFDEPFTSLGPPVLRGLRALRDRHKGWLAYIITTQAELGRLAARQESRRFAALFDQHTFGVRSYTAEDAANLIARKTLDLGQPLGQEQIDLLIRLTGGYPALLVAALGYLRSRRNVALESLARGLGRDLAVERCCHEIWSALDDRECAAVTWLAGEKSGLPPDEARRLRARGLAVGHPPVLFSDLFETCIRRNGEKWLAEKGIAGARSLLPERHWLSLIRDPEEKLDH